MSVRRIPAGCRAGGRLTPPPSKSVSNRYLTLALLAGRSVRIEHLLAAADIDHFLAALMALGWRVDRAGGAVTLEPGRRPSTANLDCGASGTMLRFLTGALCGLDGRWRLDGTHRLRERPVGPLVEALRAIGAEIEYGGEEGFAPLLIRGGRLAGGAVRLDAGLSSQFASSLLMAATRATTVVDLTLSDLTSGPYLELTVEALGRFGGRVAWRSPRRLRVFPELGGVAAARVEGDYSSAAYWAAGAALTRGTVELDGLQPGSRQADTGFLDVLEEMGLRLEWNDGRLRLAGGAPLTGVRRDLSATPDQAPTLAVLAPFARGVTRILNVPHLRLKESDRLAAVAAGLRAAGAEVREKPDGLVVPGVWAQRPPPTDPVTLDPVDDHRLAMSFAILGLRRSGISVRDAGVVAKSYPGFWRDFETVFMP